MNGKALLLNVFGGKITTYRKLAEAAPTEMKGYFPSLGKIVDKQPTSLAAIFQSMGWSIST